MAYVKFDKEYASAVKDTLTDINEEISLTLSSISSSFYGKKISLYSSFLKKYDESGELIADLTSCGINYNNAADKGGERATSIKGSVTTKVNKVIKALNKVINLVETFESQTGLSVTSEAGDLSSAFQFLSQYGDASSLSALRANSNFGNASLEGIYNFDDSILDFDGLSIWSSFGGFLEEQEDEGELESDIREFFLGKLQGYIDENGNVVIDGKDLGELNSLSMATLLQTDVGQQMKNDFENDYKAKLNELFFAGGVKEEGMSPFEDTDAILAASAVIPAAIVSMLGNNGNMAVTKNDMSTSSDEDDEEQDNTTLVSKISDWFEKHPDEVGENEAIDLLGGFIKTLDSEMSDTEFLEMVERSDLGVMLNKESSREFVDSLMNRDENDDFFDNFTDTFEEMVDENDRDASSDETSFEEEREETKNLIEKMTDVITGAKENTDKTILDENMDVLGDATEVAMNGLVIAGKTSIKDMFLNGEYRLDEDGNPYFDSGDLNLDTNGDGKPDVNIDTDGDGKAELKIDKDGENANSGKAERDENAAGDRDKGVVESSPNQNDKNISKSENNIVTQEKQHQTQYQEVQQNPPRQEQPKQNPVPVIPKPSEKNVVPDVPKPSVKIDEGKVDTKIELPEMKEEKIKSSSVVAGAAAAGAVLSGGGSSTPSVSVSVSAPTVSSAPAVAPSTPSMTVDVDMAPPTSSMSTVTQAGNVPASSASVSNAPSNVPSASTANNAINSNAPVTNNAQAGRYNSSSQASNSSVNSASSTTTTHSTEASSSKYEVIGKGKSSYAPPSDTPSDKSSRPHTSEATIDSQHQEQKTKIEDMDKQVNAVGPEGILGDSSYAELILKNEKEVKVATGISVSALAFTLALKLTNVIGIVSFVLVLLAIILVYTTFRVKKGKERKKLESLIIIEKINKEKELENKEITTEIKEEQPVEEVVTVVEETVEVPEGTVEENVIYQEEIVYVDEDGNVIDVPEGANVVYEEVVEENVQPEIELPEKKEFQSAEEVIYGEMPEKKSDSE